MGWDSSYDWKSKTDVVAETVRDYERNGYAIRAKASTRQGFYFAVTSPQNESFIIAMMVQRRGREWWRKTMSEHMGPAMDDCPLHVLDAVPCPASEYAQQFRKGCIEAKRPAPDLTGQTVSLYGKTYQVLGKLNGKRTYTMRCVATGQVYRLTTAQERQVKIIEVSK